MLKLDGAQFTDSDTFLLGALTLSAVTGQPFEMVNVGKHASPAGVTPFHLTAMRALGALCGAEMKGEAVRARAISFRPTHPPVGLDLKVDPGEATGRPSPAPVVPLIQAMIPVLARAGRAALVRFRGSNASPFAPSAFWLRESLAPMLHWAGIEIGVEIERWGWHPEGGGETTLLVESLPSEGPRARLTWEERGDPVALWAVVALSPRMDEEMGEQIAREFQRAITEMPLGHIEIELRRVRSPGPGNGLFVTMQYEHGTAGFEAISHRGMGPTALVQEVVTPLTRYFWSDAAFEPTLATALMLPLALSGHEATLTTSAFTPPMRIFETLIPRFLPVTVSLVSHPSGGQIHIRPGGVS